MWLERAAAVAASCHALLWPSLTFYVSFEGHQGIVEAKDDKKYRFDTDLPGRSWTRNMSLWYKWSANILGEISMISTAIKTTIHKNNFRCLSCALLVLQLSSFSKSITYQHCCCSTILLQPFCLGFTIKALLLLRRCFIFFIISPSPGSHLKLWLDHRRDWNRCVLHSSCIHRVQAHGYFCHFVNCSKGSCLWGSTCFTVLFQQQVWSM